MDLEEFDLTLKWPKELFLWEADRLLRRSSEPGFDNAVAMLVSEAIADDDLADQLDDNGLLGSSDARYFLTNVLRDPSLLTPFEPRRYFHTRHGRRSEVAARASLGREFTQLIGMLSEWNYFPRVVPRECVDDRSESPDVSAILTREFSTVVAWPHDFEENLIPREILFSTMEYFHDQARRPRSRSYHSYSDCGYHYADHNKQSGAAVYRWHVNTLLERHGVELKISNSAADVGNLVRRSNVGLDLLADELVEASAPGETSEDEVVAEAIRMYRDRSASVVQRRAAVTQLAGYLERHKQTFRDLQFTSKDQSDLFQIYNNFSLRHNNATQKSEYGDEYLDWIFWVTLAAIQLLQTQSPARDSPVSP
ncbi:hypothetical protein [Pseudoclavibacter sp. Z016]|uniref:hypothetical protein n=1 Tax=Pseudoclavibacter sp. Z016 TaxID=2080581 RepID=UPI000CE871B4|nr:hypothetical protein [Pseudoclavibacter sp. Z016]PPF74920.1 hypothetical protein C5B99_12280 [Pseudoclavibacter sp. Z016]